MKESPRLIITLTLIAGIAGLLVALADQKTRDPIRKAQEQAFTLALKEVLPPGAPDPRATMVQFSDGSSNNVYISEGGAVAMEAASPNGYSGDIRLLIGFTADDRLHDYTVLEHKETPGLGAHISTIFRAAVTNRPAAGEWKVTKDGGDIDAITAATISSRAVCEAIESAARRLGEIRESSGSAIIR